MSTAVLEISAEERAVWIAVCAGQVTKQFAESLGLKTRRANRVRVSLCNKLGVRPRDVPGLVRAAAAADLLKELPPLDLKPQPTTKAHW